MTPIASGMLRDLFGGFVVYRGLIPADDRLPTIGDLRSELGLENGRLPRKAEPEYAKAVGEILRKARTLSGITADVSGLLFVGDTLHNDVSAFSNLCQTMGRAGRAFIADESASTSQEVRHLEIGQLLTVSNRWGDIAQFAEDAFATGLGCDESTVVVVDIDKTLLGARGRNDHVLDKARQQAAYEVAFEVVGESLVEELEFRRIYDAVNSPAFQWLTEDNQDAVAYTSLLIACGLIQLDELSAAGASGRIDGFRALVCEMERRPTRLGRGLAQLQENVRQQVEVGNPTPFVAFRQAEYRCTVALMGCLSDDALRETMLDEEIVITEEVWVAVNAWKARGCTIFGLSDKPDEACFPPSDNADPRRMPIHCTRTHIVGGRR
jgi:hypothetical protein